MKCNFELSEAENSSTHVHVAAEGVHAPVESSVHSLQQSVYTTWVENMYWFVYTRQVLFFRYSRYTKPHQQMYKSTSINYCILFCASVYDQRSCRRETQLWGLRLCFVALVDLTRSEQGEISLERKETNAVLNIARNLSLLPPQCCYSCFCCLWKVSKSLFTPQVIKHSSSHGVVATFLTKTACFEEQYLHGAFNTFPRRIKPWALKSVHLMVYANVYACHLHHTNE